MSLKYFTNFYKGNYTDTLAINPEYVISVYESEVSTGDKKTKVVTNIFSAGTNFQVEDSYLDVVARLNERD